MAANQYLSRNFPALVYPIMLFLRFDKFDTDPNRQDVNMQLEALNNPNYYLALNDETVEKLNQLCSRCAINVNGSSDK